MTIVNQIKGLLLFIFIFLFISGSAQDFTLTITNVTDVDCNGESTGNISVLVNDPATPYDYYIYLGAPLPGNLLGGYPVNDGASTYTFPNLSAGNYTIF